MDEPSTPLQRPDAGWKNSSEMDQLCPENLGADLNRSDSLLSTRSSKHTRINEPNEKASNGLIHGIKTLHVDTPVTTNTLDASTVDNSDSQNTNSTSMLTPPSTPISKVADRHTLNPQLQRPILTHRRRSSSDFCFDIKNIEFDTTDAQLLGTGLWSKVYRLNTAIPLSVLGPSQSPPLAGRGNQGGYGDSSLLTPPSTPQKPVTSFSLPRALAIKVAARDDALPVFESEARILQHLQSCSPAASEQYVIPFYGLSVRSRALIFQCAKAGTLEELISSSSSRSAAETLDLFMTLTPQLVNGLAFLHRSGVVHADIKPANILLDHDDTAPTGSCGLRARFADFSASFICSSTDAQQKPLSNAAGGTWEFMAPEQLLRDPTLNNPTFASDVYSLAVTLLSLLVGGNPFRAVSANLFMLREAVKMGDVLDFAMREPEFEDRLMAVERCWAQAGREGKVLSALKGTLRKKREERVSALQWAEHVQHMFS